MYLQVLLHIFFIQCQAPDFDQVHREQAKQINKEGFAGDRHTSLYKTLYHPLLKHVSQLHFSSSAS